MDAQIPSQFNHVSSLGSACEKLEKDLEEGKVASNSEVAKLAEQIIKLTGEVGKIATETSDITSKQMCHDIDSMCQDLLKRTNKIAGTLQKSVHVSSDFGKGSEVTLVDEFKARPGEQNPLGRVMETVTPGFIKQLQQKGYQQLFPSYGEKTIAQQNLSKLETLRSRELNLKQELHSLNEKLSELDQRNPVSQKEIKKVLNTQAKIHTQIEDVKTQLTDTSKAIDALQTKVTKYATKVDKGRETRALLESIGGDRTKIVTSDNVTIDGVFLSSEKFQSKLAEGGGKMVTISRTFPDGFTRQLRGLSYKKTDVDKNKEHIVNLLHKMSGLPKESEANKGAGWNVVTDGDNLLLVPDSYLQDVLTDQPSPHPMIEPGSLTTLPSLMEDEPGIVSNREYKEIDPSSKGGTVILMSGNAGVYEMHKREMSAFLFKGMNVQAFNLRGYGESEGVPSARGFEQDTEAVYQYVKAKTGQPDSAILLAPFCMSGGAAAYVAGRHDVNIFLNQTYSDFHKVLEDQVVDFLERHVKDLEGDDAQNITKKAVVASWALENFQPLAKAVAGLAAPDLHIAKHLAKNKGQKAIFFVHDDATISKQHVDENIIAVAQGGGLQQLTVFSAPGSHGTCWPNVQSTPYTYSDTASQIARISDEVTQESDKLSDLIRDLIASTETQIKNLTALADRMDAEGLPPQSALPNSPPMTSSQIRAHCEVLSHDLVDEAKILRSQASTLYKQGQSVIDKLAKGVDPEEHVQSFTGRHQMSHFLDKASLSDDIIKTEFQLTKVKDPILAELKANQAYLQRVIPEITALVDSLAPLKHMKVNTLSISSTHHTFKGVDNLGQKLELPIANDRIDQLFNALVEFDSIQERNKAVASRTASAVDEKTLRTLKSAVGNLSTLVEGFYTQNNSQQASQWMDTIADLSKASDRLKVVALKPLIELEECQKAIAQKQGKQEIGKTLAQAEQDIQNLEGQWGNISDQLGGLDATMQDALTQTRNFPNEVHEVLQSGLVKIRADITKTLTFARHELEQTKQEWSMYNSSWLSRATQTLMGRRLAI